MVYRYTLPLALVLPLTTVAQTPLLTWGHALTGQGNLTNYINSGSDVVVDASGHVYMSGGFANNLDFDPGPGMASLYSTGQMDFDGFIAKYDSLGQFVRVLQIVTEGNSYIHEMALAPDGDVVISGYLNGLTDFDPTAAVVQLDAYADVFLARYDSAGALLWAKGFGAPTGLEELHALECDAAGNIWVAGQFNDTLDLDPGPGIAEFTSYAPNATDGFFAKYDGDGNYLWGHTLSVDWLDRVRGIAFEATGNAVVVGYFQGSCDMEPGPGVTMVTATSPSNDTFIARYTTDGTLLSALTFGGAASTMDPAGVAVDPNGDIIVCGEMYGNDASLTPGQVVGTIDANSNSWGWLAKYTPTGSLIWADLFTCNGSSGPNFDDIKLDGDGDIHLSGFHTNPFDADPGPNNLQLPASSDDAYLLKYANVDGALVWAVPIGGSGSQHLYGLCVDAGDHVYLTGGGYAQFPFNGSEVGGGNNAILMKTGECFPPNILFGPAVPLELCEGFEMDLSVEAEGTALHYQWLLDGTPVGGDSDSLHVGPLPQGEGGYQCVVTGPCGVDSSEVVPLFGAPVPDPVITEVGGILYANAAGVAYQWILNGTPIGGANEAFHVPTQNGTYTVSVSGDFVCVGVSPPYYFGGIGMVETPMDPLRVIHAIGTDNATVLAAPVGSTIELFDLTGKRLVVLGTRNDREELPLRGLPDGVYLVKVAGHVLRVLR